MTTTLTQEATAKLKAGANVSTALTSGNYTTFINMAEAKIMAETRIDWVALYSGLDAEFKLILDDAASSYVAIIAINYDMSGYTSRFEAITMININYTLFKDAMKLLREKYTTDFIREV